MQNRIWIRNAQIINEGRSFIGDVMIHDGIIEAVGTGLLPKEDVEYTEVAADGMVLMPGVIDDQVHFREPGMVHKADIASESKAAVAGGVTSFMEMPNTIPQTLTQELLEAKYRLASEKSLANYSFYMGASNNNLEEVLKSDAQRVCGVKVFMGSSTGNMLVDNEATLEGIFSQVKLPIAVHCEDEEIIQKNIALFKTRYGEHVPISAHPLIRSSEACYKSSSLAVGLARKHNARLHLLHLSTARELDLLDSDIPLSEKRITGEVCVHHLWFSDADYPAYGVRIKWNPAIKGVADRDGLMQGLLNDKLDVVATDHAPHTWQEKENSYFNAPSGGPLVQHALQVMLELHEQGKISLEKVVEKMCHAPAVCFKVDKRGFIREGYHADLVLLNPEKNMTVGRENILYKCKWSPFEQIKFRWGIEKTWVNGHMVYDGGVFNMEKRGERLLFNR